MARIAPSLFAHVVYRTYRFEEMLQWYKTVFGAEVLMQNPVLAFLSYDDEHHRFAFLDLSLAKPEDELREKTGLVGVDHVAYSLDSLETLFHNYRELKELGITPYWCVHHGLTVSMYYADPDGNQMEFQVDTQAGSRESLDYMRGEQMAENPVGVEYDPEEWLAQVDGGASLESFLQRTVHEPMSPIRGALGE